MTEEGAKLTRCCGPEGCGVVGNPDYEGGPSSRWCLGSGCMAWRWGIQHPYGGWIEFAPNKAIAEEQQRRENDGRVVGGFCGLAGRP